jgi:hypothetical protein
MSFDIAIEGVFLVLGIVSALMVVRDRVRAH